MSQVGQFKVLHVGGWVVRKVLNRARKYIQINVCTKSSSTLATVENEQMVSQLLEQNVIQPYTELEESLKFPEVLEVMQGRQYHKRGLLDILDQAYLLSRNPKPGPHMKWLVILHLMGLTIIANKSKTVMLLIGRSQVLYVLTY